ncbi:MAG: stage II sporulation protein D [Ruminococcus sp.]|nr:stage II sporulation protein D [Ruminococcus sp.]
MKNYFAAALFLAASIAAAPAVPAYIAGNGASAATGVPEGTSTGRETAPDAVPDEEDVQFSPEPYKVLDIASGEVMEVPVRDYVIGAVCAEMPASFSPEALKAQAVAAHTYAERQRIRERSSPTQELCGADFSNDVSRYQGYYTREQAEKFFGDRFEGSYARISAAVDDVLPYIITYCDEPIIPAFHSMSSGRTESAENVWGTAVDYLVPVDSPDDTSAPKFIQQERMGSEALRYALESAFPGIVLGDDPSDWIEVKEVSDSGTVLTVRAGDRTISGGELRIALALRSACFDVRCENDETIFTTRGYGHGVGMSQYGAEAMAKDGSTWREILDRYYPGCTISFTGLTG